ncbi:MAG TPA: hypothetical protein VM600_03195 [Actinomycetota bacterium]|nr:hypothetical protein [Actinomycetota bacterium]
MRVRRAVAVAGLLALLASSGHGARAAETSCGGTFTYESECVFDFGGFPIRVEASFVPGELRSVGIHVEVLLQVGPRMYAPGWKCEATNVGPVSCSKDHGQPLDAPLPAARDAYKLLCLVHRHGNATDSGTGSYRCASGRAS